MLIIAQVLKEKWLKITSFAYSQTTNKLVNEAANDSARVSGQDRKKPPALGTNQIAGFGGFRPLASVEKNTSGLPYLSGVPPPLRLSTSCSRFPKKFPVISQKVAQKLLFARKNKNVFWSNAKICKLYNKSKISCGVTSVAKYLCPQLKPKNEMSH